MPRDEGQTMRVFCTPNSSIRPSCDLEPVVPSTVPFSDSNDKVGSRVDEGECNAGRAAIGKSRVTGAAERCQSVLQ
jgi:hypothetical protein